jgi:broad-specificity NMP kinase
VFAVVVTGPPGAGKTACLTALTDALIDDQIAHAGVDVDEVAWAYPFPSDEQRLALLGNAWDAHRRAGHELLLAAEVVETDAHLGRLLEAVGADDHLLVRLEARPATMHERIVAREPPGWSGLQHLLAEMERYAVSLTELDGVHVTLDSERLSPEEEAARIRSERPDVLAG